MIFPNVKCYTLAQMQQARPQFFKNKPSWTHERYNVYQNHLIITQTSEEYGQRIIVWRFTGDSLRPTDIKADNLRMARALIALSLLQEESSAGLEKGES